MCYVLVSEVKPFIGVHGTEGVCMWLVICKVGVF
jgi:hypothetical protein